jgi:hypothetical protein
MTALTVTTTAHAARDAVRLEARAIVLAGVRAALVGMVQEAWVGTTPLQRLVEGAEGEVTIIDGADPHPTMKREWRSMIAAK